MIKVIKFFFLNVKAIHGYCFRFASCHEKRLRYRLSRAAVQDELYEIYI